MTCRCWWWRWRDETGEYWLGKTENNIQHRIGWRSCRRRALLSSCVLCLMCEPELRDKSPQQQCSGSLWAHQAENVHKVQGTMERLLWRWWWGWRWWWPAETSCQSRWRCIIVVIYRVTYWKWTNYQRRRFIRKSQPWLLGFSKYRHFVEWNCHTYIPFSCCWRL